MDKKDVPVIEAEKTKRADVTLDPQGFFVIEVRTNSIVVEYYKNVYKQGKIVSGSIQKVFTGSKADALCDTIAAHVPTLRPEHYLYLGRELMKAEHALRIKAPYEQGGC
jgi:dihydropteroate synthase